ncbi:hypothetical protein CK934_00725 [Chitinophaga sp. MD30]|nr:hypothetical protein CK934_00725 [Chitinophaga sp. MD30]
MPCFYKCLIQLYFSFVIPAIKHVPELLMKKAGCCKSSPSYQKFGKARAAMRRKVTIKLDIAFKFQNIACAYKEVSFIKNTWPWNRILCP